MDRGFVDRMLGEMWNSGWMGCGYELGDGGLRSFPWENWLWRVKYGEKEVLYHL
jgi:hypothetical protein